jgi:AAA domain
MSNPSEKGLIGPKILLEGPAGTGKTHAIATAVEWASSNNMRVVCLFTENGLETLLGFWKDKGKPVPANLFYHQAMTRPVSLAALIKAADSVGKLSYEGVTKMIDPDRAKSNAFHKLLEACSNFPDDRTGTKLGPVDAFGPDTIFVIDSLSELSNAALKMVIGNRPTAAPPDYGVAQNNLMNFLRLCTQGIECSFIMTAHVSREKDEITGGVKLMTKAVGAALANEIPQLFSDVIYTVRNGDKFTWDTAAANVDVKTRNLPIAAGISPDFGQIFAKWRNRSAA